MPRLRDQITVMRWLRQGDYVSREPLKQRMLFGDQPSIVETVTLYARE